MLGRVQAVYHGGPAGIDEAKDDVYSFFQNIHHLKDWLRHDPASHVTKADVETFIKNSSELSICADLCNGSKHLKLTSPLTGDPATAVTKLSAEHLSAGHAVVLGGGGTPQPLVLSPAKVIRRFEVSSGNSQHDVLDLAMSAYEQWRVWLTGKGLL
jgi:hypothetical protein